MRDTSSLWYLGVIAPGAPSLHGWPIKTAAAEVRAKGARAGLSGVHPCSARGAGYNRYPALVYSCVCVRTVRVASAKLLIPHSLVAAWCHT